MSLEFQNPLDEIEKEATAFKKFVTGSLRFRNIYIFTLTVLVLVAFVLFDPDLGLVSDMSWGATTVATFLVLLKAIPAITLLHFSRKAIADYIDIEALYKKIMADDVEKNSAAVGAGLFMIGVGLLLIALATIISKVM